MSPTFRFSSSANFLESATVPGSISVTSLSRSRILYSFFPSVTVSTPFCFSLDAAFLTADTSNALVIISSPSSELASFLTSSASASSASLIWYCAGVVLSNTIASISARSPLQPAPYTIRSIPNAVPAILINALILPLEMSRRLYRAENDNFSQNGSLSARHFFPALGAAGRSASAGFIFNSFLQLTYAANAHITTIADRIAKYIILNSLFLPGTI